MAVSRVSSRSRCSTGAATRRTSIWLHALVPSPIAAGPSAYVASPGTACTSDRDDERLQDPVHDGLAQVDLARELPVTPSGRSERANSSQDVGHTIGRLGPSHRRLALVGHRSSAAASGPLISAVLFR